jgi:ADP-ribose pyrophosphatase YjhB (NUDIX family)
MTTSKRRLLAKPFQLYWKISRGLTLGAQGVVIDPQNRVLLIRHTYRPGWHFPGGGVEKNETVMTALVRELDEEAGVICNGTPELFGLYANARYFPGDHIALFVVKDWTQPRVPPPNREIAQQSFFALDALPPEIHPPSRARLGEIFHGHPRSELW